MINKFLMEDIARILEAPVAVKQGMRIRIPCDSFIKRLED
jgi:hypothetical protein